MFEKMYPNTMVLDQNFQAKSRYVFHIDAQYRIYRTSWAKDAPNFVEKALSLMRSDARVYMASVVSTPNVDPEHDRHARAHARARSAPHERMNGLMQGWKPVTGPWSERPVRAETFNANWTNAGERKDARKMKLVRLISKDRRWQRRQHSPVPHGRRSLQRAVPAGPLRPPCRPHVGRQHGRTDPRYREGLPGVLQRDVWGVRGALGAPPGARDRGVSARAFSAR
ncbi:unnamed protein product [Prorocentrum cordatum]|uniref:Uncharacterized protein n=1 Tax=Prorocentrum cordatum TaxID=2364126 RepID=A0ABN9SEW5_9DINO|nr:unnamed protein product [Polarella glacialis]